MKIILMHDSLPAIHVTITVEEYNRIMKILLGDFLNDVQTKILANEKLEEAYLPDEIISRKYDS